MIGMVSMDFDDQLPEKVEAAFNTFMQTYSDLLLWEWLDKTIIDYFQTATVIGSWFEPPKAGSQANNLHSSFPTAADAATAITEIAGKLSGKDKTWFERLISKTDSKLNYQHNLLESIQRPDTFVPALWVALSSGTKDDLVIDDLETSFNLQIITTYPPEKEALFRRVHVQGGDLFGKWQWTDCSFQTPWLVLKGTSRHNSVTTTRNITKPRMDGSGDFSSCLWNLSNTIAELFPADFDHLVEVRIVKNCITDLNEALSCLYNKTPIAVILDNTKMFVCVRSNWAIA